RTRPTNRWMGFARRTRHVLEGKPLKMPLNVLLVHFPLALFVLSLLLDIAAYVVGGSNVMVRSASLTLALGLIAAAIAAIPGLVDYTSIRRDHPGRATATWHLILNIAAVLLYALSLALRRGRLDLLRTPPAPLVLSIIAVTTISFSGYLGGILVYDNGIGVGRHRRRTPLPKSTLLAGAQQKDPDGFI